MQLHAYGNMVQNFKLRIIPYNYMDLTDESDQEEWLYDTDHGGAFLNPLAV